MKVNKKVLRVIAGSMVLGLFLGGCGVPANPSGTIAPTTNPHASITYEKGRDFVGVLKSADLVGKRLTLYNTTKEEEEMCEYSGGTEILTKNGKAISSESLEVGQVLDVYRDAETGKISKLQLSSDILEQERVKDFVVNTDEKYLEVAGVRYRYGSGFTAFSMGEPIDISEITKQDEVTFRGVKGKAYSLVVTKGHGYLQPKKYKDFIGGTLTIRGVMIVPVTEKMLIPVPEGSYDVCMKNGDFVGSRTVTIERDEHMVLDMSLFKSVVGNRGQVEFDINPVGAELYINGALKEYSKPVSLSYGKHSVQVVLDGYTTYAGVIDVQSANPTVRIDLAEEEAEVADDSEGTSVEADDSSDGDSAGEYDNDHTITVTAPEGASVYLDGTYKGVAPCSFPKKIGSVTITLSKTGYTTKSYAMTTTDDKEDVSFAFPELASTAVG